MTFSTPAFASVVLLPFLLIGTVGACGGGGDGDGDGDGPPQGGDCVPNAADYSVCIEGASFLCPAEGGEPAEEDGWVEMELLRDCEADGLACDEFDGVCVDPDGHIVGDSAMSYAETILMSVESEETSYTVDVDGLAISGSLAEGDADAFTFSTGTFERVNVQVFLDGVAQTQGDSEVRVSLDAATDDGLSTLTGDGYFIGAYVTPGSSYVISLSAAPASGEYTIELVGSSG